MWKGRARVDAILRRDWAKRNVVGTDLVEIRKILQVVNSQKGESQRQRLAPRRLKARHRAVHLRRASPPLPTAHLPKPRSSPARTARNARSLSRRHWRLSDLACQRRGPTRNPVHPDARRRLRRARAAARRCAAQKRAKRARPPSLARLARPPRAPLRPSRPFPRRGTRQARQRAGAVGRSAGRSAPRSENERGR